MKRSGCKDGRRGNLQKSVCKDEIILVGKKDSGVHDTKLFVST